MTRQSFSDPILVAVTGIVVALTVLTVPGWALDDSVGQGGIGADVLHGFPDSLTGAGVNVGVLNDWIDAHPNLNLAGNGGSGPATAHATEVAGVINSNHPIYRGAAPGADLYGYSVSTWTDTFDGSEWLVNQGATIITYPFGWALEGDLLDGSSWETRHLDFLARDQNVLFAVAGNQGSGGYPLPSDSFNGMTVNATVMTDSGRYDQVAGWNYFDEVPVDGRRKPDLVAPGGYEYWPERHPESIYTTTLGGGFENVSGTSFAAPHVAGVAALLTEYGHANSLSTHHNVLRSVLINSADKTTRDSSGNDWLQSDAFFDEYVPLDDELGAGQLDAAAAFRQYRAGENDPGTVSRIGWDLHTITGEGSVDHYLFPKQLLGGSYVTATLTWDRRVTLENDQDGDGEFDWYDTDSLSAHDLDDLDINLYDGNGDPVWGSWSSVDNVEHIHWQVPESGTYFLGVEFWQQLDLPSVEYAFAWNVVFTPLRSAATGPWSEASTWDDGVLAPTQQFDVIVAGETVTLSAPLGNAFSVAIADSESQLVISPQSTLSVATDVEIGPGALNIAIQGLDHGQVIAGGDLRLDPGSTLILQPRGKLQAEGHSTRTILSAAAIQGTFSHQPASGDHLGFGVFLTNAGVNLQGITYGAEEVQIDVFQAADGDSNGDRVVNGLDIQAILAANKFGRDVDADWMQGDFDGDRRVNGLDIQAILARNLFGQPPYAGSLPTADDAGIVQAGVVELVLGPDGLLVDTVSDPINGYVLTSRSGIFTGEPAVNLGLFQEDSDTRISGNFAFELLGTHLIGNVIGGQFAGWSLAKLAEDLTFTYSIAGRGGVYRATLVVPEPGTIVTLLAGVVAGLVALAVRRNRQGRMGL
ncbi:MAG: S8 family serine peptidase [Pirellulales bacterium]|nr:S8 family serine peptidase [Pirellulales bacterium]